MSDVFVACAIERLTTAARYLQSDVARDIRILIDAVTGANGASDPVGTKAGTVEQESGNEWQSDPRD